MRGRAFAWERPLRAKDVAELADRTLPDLALGMHVADEGVKQALLAGQPEVFFTTSHFDGHASVLVRLDALDPQELRELLHEAWLARAPKRLAAHHRPA